MEAGSCGDASSTAAWAGVVTPDYPNFPVSYELSPRPVSEPPGSYRLCWSHNPGLATGAEHFPVHVRAVWTPNRRTGSHKT